ncbi:hypothetical protein EDF22_3092 [Rathayibacter sp. PhB127]|nr:hypothetical protein EDF22_3092 [Rathayibacter sp. PhB127]
MLCAAGSRYARGAGYSTSMEGRGPGYSTSMEGLGAGCATSTMRATGRGRASMLVE